MFDNISDKIKNLAIILTVLGCIISVVSGFVLMEELPLFGVLIIILGSILSYCSSFILYGFGEIINQLEHLNSNLIKSNWSNEKKAKQNSNYSLSKSAAENPNNDFWVCKNCGTKNDSKSLSCKDCGKYK